MNYTISKVKFTSSNGKNRVCGLVYAPKGEAIGLLQISHGMCEYIGRYSWFMKEMAERGFVVFGHDHIGHGDSSAPEEYGYFAEKDGYRYLIQDIFRMSSIVQEKYPNLPLYLFGHSMGSFVSRLTLPKYASKLSGVILCGTSGPNPMAKAGIAIADRVAKSKGADYREEKLQKMAFGSYNNKYEIKRTHCDWLSRDEEVVNEYLRDPRCTFMFTASAFRDLFTMVNLCNKKEWFAALPKDLPILLIAGDADPVGNYGKGVQKVMEKLVENGMSDVSMNLYPEARHELLNEINKEEVLQDIQIWLKERLPLEI